MPTLKFLAATAATALTFSLSPVMACDDFDEEMALAAAVHAAKAVSPQPAPGAEIGAAAGPSPMPTNLASVGARAQSIEPHGSTAAVRRP